MNLQKSIKFLPLLCALALLVVGFLGMRPVSAQQGISSTSIIAGQTTCSDAGVRASVDVGNPLPGFTAYYDVELAGVMQTSDELAAGQWYHFEFLLPHQEFAATTTEALMSVYSDDPEQDEDVIPVQISWPAVSCGPHPTIVTETVPTTIADTFVIEPLTATSTIITTTIHAAPTTTEPETAEVDIIDAASVDRSGLVTTTSLEEIDDQQSRGELAYTGPSRLNVVLALIGLGIALIGCSLFGLRGRPLHKRGY